MGLLDFFSSKKEPAREKREVNLKQLEEQFRGTTFNHLIERHLQRQNDRERNASLTQTISQLPSTIQPLIMEWIDRWNSPAYDPSFWHEDTSKILIRITEDAKSFLRNNGCSIYNDELLFDMFNIVVMNFAYSASGQPTMRKFMGIK